MKDNFKQLILVNIKEGMIFKNPRKGTSTITKVTPEYITYMRGHSYITIKLDVLYTTYKRFSGSICSTLDLKKYDESVFSSKQNGHDCNCTFFFTILCYLKLSSEIKGNGVRGNPFYVNIE